MRFTSPRRPRRNAAPEPVVDLTLAPGSPQPAAGPALARPPAIARRVSPPPATTPAPADGPGDWRAKVWEDSQRRAQAELDAKIQAVKAPAGAAAPADPDDTPFGRLVGGVVLLGLSVVLYFVLTDMEATDGSVRVHWLVAVAYTIGGKWGATLFVAVLGLFSLVTGLNRLNASAARPAGRPSH